MSKTLVKPEIPLPIVTQITESHCGPAVLQMLFAHVRKTFNQEQIAQAAGVAKRIKDDGTRPAQLARAVGRLTLTHQLWFKQHTNFEDIDTLIHEHHWPVGINWQGFFYENQAEENKKRFINDDYGHYSVVVDIDLKKKTITIADTYQEFSISPRVFDLEWFQKRWHDEVEDIDKKAGTKKITQTQQLIFIIAPKKAKFPEKLDMLPPSKIGRLTIEKQLSLLEKLFKRA